MKHKLKIFIATLLSFIMIMSCFSVFAESADSDITILYVAKDGKDTNKGTEKSPFATITAARDAIRSMKKAGTLGSDGAVVYVREGEYIIQNGIKFNSEDSGTEDAPIVYRAYPGEKVILSGAANLSWDMFKKTESEVVLERLADKGAKDKLMEVDLFAVGYTELPELPWPGTYSYAQGMQMIHGRSAPSAAAPALMINGKEMTVARYPNEGYMTIFEVPEPGANPREWEKDRIGSDMYIPPEQQIPTPFTVMFENDRMKYWTKAEDALITGYFYWSWAAQTVPLASVDPQKQTITSKYPSEYSVRKDQNLYVYNLIEEIDMPGEYYVDRKAGKLYVYPPLETIDTIVYTTLEEYMFSFADADYITLKDFEMSQMRSGAVKTDGDTEFCNIVDCDINYTGKSAVILNGYNNNVLDCYIHMNEGGIQILGGDKATLTPGNNVVENCDFEANDRYSKTYNYAIYIDGVGNKLLNSKVHKADHTLITFKGNDHLLAYNEIYDACQFTDDMGAIYTGRNLTCWGNVVAHNYIHDVKSEGAHGNDGIFGIYFDDWFSNADIYGNVFEDIGGYAFFGGGSHNKIYNNIMANCKGAVIFGRQLENDYTVSRNTHYNVLMESPWWQTELWQEHYPGIENLYRAELDSGDYSNIEGILAPFDIQNDLQAYNNVFYKTGEIRTQPHFLNRGAVIENNAVYATDPGFYDLENGNYLLKPDSKVYEEIEGFKPILFTRMGMYSERAVDRVRGSYVAYAGSKNVMKKGSVTETPESGIKEINGKLYISVREFADVAEGIVDYNADTNEVIISTGAAEVKFTDGGVIDKVMLNGEEKALSTPVVEIDDKNYILAQDVAELFGKYVYEQDKVLVISDTEGLFDAKIDGGLLRYLGEQLTVY